MQTAEASASVTNFVQFFAWFVHWFIDCTPHQRILFKCIESYILNTIFMRMSKYFPSHFGTMKIECVSHAAPLYFSSYSTRNRAICVNAVFGHFAINRRLIVEKHGFIHRRHEWVERGTRSGHFNFTKLYYRLFILFALPVVYLIASPTSELIYLKPQML